VTTTNASDAQAISELALAAGEPTVLDPESRYAVVVPDGGSVEVLEPKPDSALLNPRRTSGTTTVLDADSLAVLWAKHSLAEVSEVFADPQAFRFTAVLNADAGANAPAGHRDHRIELALRHTPSWLAWAGRDKRLSGQEEFAEFIEDRLPDIVDPSGASMLELASSFQATTKAEFKGAVALQSSTRKLQFEETIAARAGQKGEIEIPATFQLGLVPFEGSDAYRVTARFRYRIRDGHLQIGYALERPEDVLRQAFKDVQDAVSEATGQRVLLGTPPPARG
jgi:uncharacterized protein YfdQ (DUF2303 family)